MNCTGTYEEPLSILLEENKNTEPFSEGGTEIDIGNHTLVVCFSATGNTKAVAETIAKAVSYTHLISIYTDTDWCNSAHTGDYKFLFRHETIYHLYATVFLNVRKRPVRVSKPEVIRVPCVFSI